jgi:hypothetical protein
MADPYKLRSRYRDCFGNVSQRRVRAENAKPQILNNKQCSIFKHSMTETGQRAFSLTSFQLETEAKNTQANSFQAWLRETRRPLVYYLDQFVTDLEKSNIY